MELYAFFTLHIKLHIMSPLKLIVLMIENWMDLFMIVLICIHTCICRSHLPNITKQTKDVQAFKIILEKKIFNIVFFFILVICLNLYGYNFVLL